MLNGKLHFLCSEDVFSDNYFYDTYEESTESSDNDKI